MRLILGKSNWSKTSYFAAIKPASLAPLDISKAKMFGKKRHGSSPDSGIADMRGYAPYYPSSESMNGQAGTGQHFQYTGDIQEDCAPQEEQLQNTSFQETIPGQLHYLLCNHLNSFF